MFKLMKEKALNYLINLVTKCESTIRTRNNSIPTFNCRTDTSHYILHCHYFSHHPVDLMNSVKPVCDNFESMPDNVKKDLLLFGDSRFDENKNKVILEATKSYIKILEDSLVPYLNNVLLLSDFHLQTYNTTT